MTTTTSHRPHQDAILRSRRAIWANGFRPVPVRTGEKVPAESRWPDRARMNPPSCVAPDAVVAVGAESTGILCDGLCVIDADIDHAETAEAVWRLATDMLGEAPVRFRRGSDRFLLVYRAAEGEPHKRTLKGAAGAVEVLGHGNQFVALGRHPSGAEYEWSDGSPETRHSDILPAVTEERVLEFLAACAPLIDAELGKAPTPSRAMVLPSSLPSIGTTAWGRAALIAECDRVATALPGVQSDTLASAVYKIGQRIASGEIARGEAEAALLAAGMQMTNGDERRRWTPRQITDVLRRQIEAGLGSPIGPDRVEERVVVDLDGSFAGRAEIGSSNETKPKAVKTPIVPVPADAPAMMFKHPAWGEPHESWPYRGAAGQLVGYVARWRASTAEPEHTAHITYCDLGPDRRAAWRMRPMPSRRPLFNLPALLARPDSTVAICPDEHLAELALTLMPDMAATTTAYDAKSPASSDFAPLAGRSILLVPNVGREGKAWSDMVAALAAKAGAADVKTLDLARLANGMNRESSPADGWSLSDAADGGLTAEALAALLHIDPELISFHVDERKRCAANALLHAEITPTVEQAMPLFKSDDSGVSKLVERQESGETIREYVRFCSQLTVVAETRDADGRNWGRLLSVVDRDNTHKEWAMPMEQLAGDGVSYRSELLSMGLDLAPGRKAREFLHEFISYERPKEKARCVSRTGWHGRAYVAIDETLGVGQNSQERLLLQTAVPPDHPFRTAGSLAGWQDEIARSAIGNSRLALAISAAFAAPLLHPLDAEGGGFHLRGGSSTGKSTALAVGGSVWGGGGLNGFLRTWRATSNGLEGVAALHCDALLCLDEMGQVDGREAGAIAYMLANGAGKSRAGRSGDARSAASWRVLFLSSGEVSLADKLAEDGRARRAAAGQEVRIVDIPADAGAGLGLFEDLQEFGSADAFSRHLKGAAARHYGHPSRAFLKVVVDCFDDIQREARSSCHKFVRDHCPEGADGQISRVAARFGLIAAAGEIAREARILPWPEGEAMRAAGRCFRDWLAQRGGIEPAEERNAIAQVRHFIELHGASRFEPIGDGREHAEARVINRAGFRAGDAINGYEYIVLPEAWKADVCTGMDAIFVTKSLAQRGLLKVGSDGKAQIKRRLPGFENPVRCYVLNSSVMDDLPV